MKSLRLMLILAFALASAAANAKTIRVEVNGLVCAFCANGITEAFNRRTDVSDVFVSLEHRLVAIAVKDGKDIADAELTKTLTDAGYTVVGIARVDTTLDAIRAEVANE